MKYLYLSVFSLVFITACTSAKKSFERQDYDAAVYMVADKISKNKKIKDEDIQLLEEAYYRALERDKNKIQQLKLTNRQELWVDIFNIYTNMIQRQDAILKISPVYYSDGKAFHISALNFSPAREEAREKASEYHYKEATYLLNTNLRSDARKAYNHLDCIFYYYRDYRDAGDLLAMAKDRGTAHVLLSVDKNPQLFLPQDFEYELLNYNYGSALNEWVTLYTNSNARSNFDFAVRLVITESFISPGSIKETFYNEEKEVEDGWQYVYDHRGNVMKDSSGNDIKAPKYTKLTARVTEVQMHRSAAIRGAVDFYDFARHRNIKQEAAQGESIFNHYYATYTGNRNALSSESLKKIQNQPAPFPSDADMIILATNELKKQFRNIFYANSRMFNYD